MHGSVKSTEIQLVTIVLKLCATKYLYILAPFRGNSSEHLNTRQLHRRAIQLHNT